MEEFKVEIHAASGCTMSVIIKREAEMGVGWVWGEGVRGTGCFLIDQSHVGCVGIQFADRVIDA
ncbi:hypothetical protein J6590_009862 [Homalodisca vitripennis]|nr:hypothetical protein J6590_009862 [Homalodisca vitripennis]